MEIHMNDMALREKNICCAVIAPEWDMNSSLKKQNW